jgi:uncharacterized membrane protein (UPF0127 family)
MKRLLATFIIAFCGQAWTAQTLPEVALEINGHKVTAEVADTDATRAIGLMYRRMLPENRGMLFVFPQPAPQNFWMMNTYIPLSIAFIDKAGLIINIDDMKPLTTDPHPSARPALYALEMNQGWFAKRGIKAGARIHGLNHVSQRDKKQPSPVKSLAPSPAGY